MSGSIKNPGDNERKQGDEKKGGDLIRGVAEGTVVKAASAAILEVFSWGAKKVDEYNQIAEAQGIMDRANSYLNKGHYKEAEPLYNQALTIYEQAAGPYHFHTATCRYNLAILYCEQGRYEEAQSLNERALANLNQSVGSEHPNFAMTLNLKGGIYCEYGRY